MFRVPPSCPASFRRRVERCSAVLAGTALCCLLFAAPAWAQVTLLVPGQPSIEAPAKTEKSEAQAKGREEGKRIAILDIAKAMLKRGLDTDAIMEMTGLSKDELQKLVQ